MNNTSSDNPNAENETEKSAQSQAVEEDAALGAAAQMFAEAEEEFEQEQDKDAALGAAAQMFADAEEEYEQEQDKDAALGAAAQMFAEAEEEYEQTEKAKEIEPEQAPASVPVSKLLTSKEIVIALQQKLATKYKDMQFNPDEGTIGFKGAHQLGVIAENMARIQKENGQVPFKIDVTIDNKKIDDYAKSVFLGAAKAGIHPKDVTLTINGKNISADKYKKDSKKWSSLALGANATTGKISVKPMSASKIVAPKSPESDEPDSRPPQPKL